MTCSFGKLHIRIQLQLGCSVIWLCYSYCKHLPQHYKSGLSRNPLHLPVTQAVKSAPHATCRIAFPISFSTFFGCRYEAWSPCPSWPTILAPPCTFWGWKKFPVVQQKPDQICLPQNDGLILTAQVYSSFSTDTTAKWFSPAHTYWALLPALNVSSFWGVNFPPPQ